MDKVFKFDIGDKAYLLETKMQPHTVLGMLFDGKENQYSFDKCAMQFKEFIPYHVDGFAPERNLFTFSEMKNMLVITEEECAAIEKKIEKLGG